MDPVDGSLAGVQLIEPSDVGVRRVFADEDLDR
jgi:hypothetical protein